jgi:hypothetical protein
MGWLRRSRVPALALVFTVSGVVLFAASIDIWVSDQERYEAFRASSACTQRLGPADDDCVALRPARVLNVQDYKNVTNVSVQGWPELDFGSDPGFVSGLRTGATVEVIVWRGVAQGLETTSDGPDYLSGSAVLAPTRDYARALVGVFLLCLGGLFGADVLLRRYGVDRGRIRALEWSFGAAAGLAILHVLGVILTNSFTGGFIADGLLGALTLVVIGLMWISGKRHRPGSRPQTQTQLQRQRAQLPR